MIITGEAVGGGDGGGVHGTLYTFHSFSYKPKTALKNEGCYFFKKRIFRKWHIIHTHTSFIKYMLTFKDIRNMKRLEGNIQKYCHSLR